MITENGQVGKSEIDAFLEVCCQRISEAYGKPDSDKWTNSDYVSLSYILFKQTRVRISPNTLKRIFGKIRTDARYYPQKATRDALASYIGYPDWDHFVQVQQWTEKQAAQPPVALAIHAEVPKAPAQEVAKVSSPKANFSRRKRWLFLLSGAGLLILFIVMLWLKRSTQGDLPQLVCRNPLGENPHSAIFELKHEDGLSESDTYTVRFGDGKQVRITPTDSLYSHYYERPGRYFATLLRNGKAIDTATVYLQTHGWAVTASMMYDSTRVYPIDIKNLFERDRRSVSTMEAVHAGVDTNRTFFMEFTSSHPSAIDGDNFELITHLKTSADRAGVRCSQVGITVWGESSQHEFEVMKPGCAHWMALQNSEILKKGHRDDLSFMGADLRSGGTLRMRVANQQVTIFINNRKVYQTHYQNPLHTVYGVKIMFAGIGTVDSFSLKDLKSNALFDGNF